MIIVGRGGDSKENMKETAREIVIASSRIVS